MEKIQTHAIFTHMDDAIYHFSFLRINKSHLIYAIPIVQLDSDRNFISKTSILKDIISSIKLQINKYDK